MRKQLICGFSECVWHFIFIHRIASWCRSCSCTLWIQKMLIMMTFFYIYILSSCASLVFYWHHHNKYQLDFSQYASTRCIRETDSNVVTSRCCCCSKLIEYGERAYQPSYFRFKTIIFVSSKSCFWIGAGKKMSLFL